MRVRHTTRQLYIQGKETPVITEEEEADNG
jgi:hypothetical protein